MQPPANAPVQILHGDERAMLHEFWRLAANTHLFVGHNVLDFDLRFIWQRSIIHQIKPTRDISFARHHSEPIYDTMQEWSKWGREHISLAALSRALDIPSPKEKLDGAKVYPYYREGRLAEICDYCKRDVESVRAVYHRLTFSRVTEL
jgi:predicted PolB exonuclease-like 3'-5' exonuclease